MLFELLQKVGSHFEPSGKKGVPDIKFVPGDKIESNKDLVKLFPNKFKLIGSSVPGDVGTPNIPVPDKADGEGLGDVSSPSESGIDEKSRPHGKRVSGQFKGCKKLGVRVYVKDAWYVVASRDDDELLTDKKLRKTQVQGFLDGLREESIED